MREKFLLAVVAWVCLLLPQIYEMYYAGYHRFVESPMAAIVGGLLAPLVMIAPVVIGAMFLRTQILMRLFAGLLVLYSIDRLAASLNPALLHSKGVELAFIAAGAVLLLLCLRYLSSSGWARMARMILAAALAWILVFPASAWVKAGARSALDSTLSVARVLERSPHAVAVLIMDETAPQGLDRLRTALAALPGQIVHSTLSESAGQATVFAIPSMLTVSRHDDVVPCGATQLCGSTSFNMRNLLASRPDIDIVGTYHPYCAIHGLRSCWTAEVTNPGSPDVNRDVLKAIGRRLPFVGDLFDVELDESAAMSYAREGVVERASKMPFWKHGGILYVHYLLPHPVAWPTWGGHVHNLSEEYKANVDEAGEFIGSFNRQLRTVFGLDYALIVTSDHSLRTSFWCSKPFFDTPGCLSENPPYVDRVPFLVLAPDSVKVTLPTTNVGIFTPLPKND